MRAVAEFGFAGYRLRVHAPVRAHFYLCVKAAHAVESDYAFIQRAEAARIGAQFAVGIDESNAVVFADLAVYAKDAKICIVAGKRITLNHSLAGRLIVCDQCANRPFINFSGQADAIERIHNPPGKYQVERRREIAGVFLKEGPLLRKENLKPLVHRDLWIVGFHLPEVRINRAVQHQAVFQDNLGIQSCFRFQVLTGKAVASRIAFIQAPESADRCIGNELHVSSRRDSLKSLYLLGLYKPPLNPAGVFRVKRALVIAWNHPRQ